MATKLSVAVLAAGLLIGTASAVEAAPEKSGDSPDAPSLEALKAVIQPMLDKLGLDEKQKGRARGVMSADSWETISGGFETKRKGEIFTAAHSLMPKLIPTIVQPKMMAYNMQKTMAKRMAGKIGPPSQKEIEQTRDKTRKIMRGKIAPTLMGNLEELAAARVEELMADKKVLVRVLGDKVSEIVLTDEKRPAFEKALTDAGYTQDLVKGADPVLDERAKKMAVKVAEEKIAELQKEDGAAAEE